MPQPRWTGAEPCLVAYPGHPTVLVAPGDPAPDGIPADALGAGWEPDTPTSKPKTAPTKEG